MEDINTYLTILAALVAAMGIKTLWLGYKHNQLIEKSVAALEEYMSTNNLEDIVKALEREED